MATEEYSPSTTTRRTEEALVNASDLWTQGIQNFTEQFGPARIPAIPAIPVDPTAFVEQWFDFTDRVSKINREYVLNLAGALNSVAGAVRQHVDGLGEAVREQVQAVSSTTKEQLDRVVEAEREQAREARNAERQKARQQRQEARERYEGLTKAELSTELGHRDLPKTGTVDELVERLVEADTK